MPLPRLRAITRLWAVAAVLAAVGVAALAIDVPLARWVDQADLPSSVRKLFGLSETFGHAVGVGLILLTIGVLDPRHRPSIARIAAASLGSGLVANVFKLLVARVRPHHFDLQSDALDSFAGTHVVLPGFSLPEDGFDNNRYSDGLRDSLARYEARYGPRGTSSLTTEQAPLNQMMGPAHVIDVRKLIGTTDPGSWPASPQITLDFIQRHESNARPIRAGDVVVFYSGYSDEHFQPLPPAPEVDRLFAAPLAGKAEGWPSPTPDAIAYLADKGVRCIGTDGPTLGGADPEQALFVNWLAASRGIFPVEYLTNVGEINGRDAFFLFAPIKIEGTRGGYGRALALY